MDTITFSVTRNPGEGYCAVARGAGYSLVTEGASLDELACMIQDVIAAYFEDPQARPHRILWLFDAETVAA
jgi:hypothetical protein